MCVCVCVSVLWIDGGDHNLELAYRDLPTPPVIRYFSLVPTPQDSTVGTSPPWVSPKGGERVGESVPTSQ